MTIFVTSDLHIGHNKDFMYEPRGFKTIEEHDSELVKKWNEIVKHDDEVYVLGDLMMIDTEYGAKVFNRLYGKKHIILGNHDSDNKIETYKHQLNNIIDIQYATLIRYNNKHFYLSHYPTIMADGYKKPKIIGLHGHTHNKNKFEYIDYCSYNVALDAHDMKPVSLDEVIEDIKKYRDKWR